MENKYVSVLVGPASVLSALGEKYDVRIGAYEKQTNDVSGFSFGYYLREEMRKHGVIDMVKWDFLSIALGISAADIAVDRASRFDGWTRRIDLTVAVKKSDVFTVDILSQLESCLTILTGDFWKLHVIDGGADQAPQKRRQRKNSYKEYDSICLLSGGSDSLVGAIDLIAAGHHPLFASETVKKSRQIRDDIISSLYGSEELSKMIRVNPCIRATKKGWNGEISTRSRSIRFIAYAIAASSLLKHLNGPIEIHIPENGFISINPPLTIGRLGSLSTKTTYPPYLDGLQKVFDLLKFNVKIVSDYRFKTKGEMFLECKNQELLKSLLPRAVSCGKIGRKQRACGKCVPCIVRRAAEYAYTGDINFTKRDTDYPELKTVLTDKNPKKNSDLSSMVYALKKLKNYSVSCEYSSQLSFASGLDKEEYENMLKRGFLEIKTYLEACGIDI